MRPVRSSRRVAAPVSALLIVAALCAIGVVHAQEVLPTFNVRNYGAVGNGTTNDTAAIQKADDAAAKAGGGTVYFPAGTYSAMGIKQDSNVHFLGDIGSTLLHRNGTSATPIVTSRLTKTRGSMSAGSNTLSVTSAYRMVPGAIVGIRGAGGPSEVQKTTLTAAVTAGAGLFMLKQPNGWGVNVRNYVLIGNEIISYQGISGNALMSVRRGLFGTRAAAHSAGARVSQAQGLYARITSVVGTTIGLDRPAVKGVSSANVWTGAVNMSLRGLTIDGRRPANPSPAVPVVSVRYELARWVSVENNSFVKAVHGGVKLDQGTSDSVIANNVFLENGNPDDGMGSAVWLGRSVAYNAVNDNYIGGDSHIGVSIDDRTVGSTEWDGSSEDNLIRHNIVDIPPIDGQAAIFVSGSNRNQIVENDVRSTKRGIAVVRSLQGTNPGDSEGNVVRDNLMSNHSWGLHATGSYNTFINNLIELTEDPIVDTGVGNTFS